MRRTQNKTVWECPKCSKKNERYISQTTGVNCTKCKQMVFWGGDKVITYEEWLDK